MAVLTINAIFRGVMGMECSHTYSVVKLKYSALYRGGKAGITVNSGCGPRKPKYGNFDGAKARFYASETSDPRRRTRTERFWQQAL
jgi:hypothetical protein